MASSASKTTTTQVLKPLPASAEDFKKELQSFQNLDQDSEPPPRAKLYHYIMSSAKIKRPFDTAMILLVGSSGVGKSSTLNHLLDTGEGVPVAMTSTTQSETRKTSEYVLSIDEPKYEVCDLKMSVVDTPGFNDTAGTNQDAFNFVSIKRFFETYPKIPEQLTFPNLVFLVVNTMDSRINGPNSNLSKCLRGIKLLNVIDTSCPNLVVVVTFCCSVPHKDVNKWNEKMQKKKDVISTAVFEVFNVQMPLVLIENEYDEHELSKDGDYTLLPNGEKQPKNLYDACLKLLEQNKDHFGLMVLNASFERCKKDRPTNGHEVEAKNSLVETLSDEEEEFFKAFSEAAKGGQDPIALRAMKYVKENHLEKSQQQKVMKQVETTNSLGLSNEEKLQNVTNSKINCDHNEEIPKHEIKKLKKKSEINHAEFVGQGYDIITDKSVSAQIMTFSAINEEKFGFRIPACAQIDKVNETRERQKEFHSDESYKASELENLDLDVALSQSIVWTAPEFKFSTSGKNNRSGKSMKTTKSILTEYRMAKISIPNWKSDDISFTHDFRTAVTELPSDYTSGEKPKQKFKKFFNRFGQFVVVSAYVGGAVEKKNCSESLKRSKKDNQSVDGSAGASVSGVTRVKANGKTEQSTESAKNVVSNETKTWWQGGQSDLHSESTLQSEDSLRKWKASLSKEPGLLKTEFSLEPISSVVAIIDKTKGEVCEQALRDHFHDKELPSVRNLQDQPDLEEKKKIEKDKHELHRNQSNTRSGTTKEPDTKGLWENISYKHVIGTIVVVLGVIAAIVIKKK